LELLQRRGFVAAKSSMSSLLLSIFRFDLLDCHA
jgi:hypothetical protein